MSRHEIPQGPKPTDVWLDQYSILLKQLEADPNNATLLAQKADMEKAMKASQAIDIDSTLDSLNTSRASTTGEMATPELTADRPYSDQRNQEIWDKQLKKFSDDSSGSISTWFMSLGDSIREYKEDIEKLIVVFGKTKQDYYRGQVADLDRALKELLDQRKPDSSLAVLKRVKNESLELFREYMALHYSCGNDATKKSRI
ncbi:MAG: hypothetical protein WC465_00080 [Patescibacteria group bacterium]